MKQIIIGLTILLLITAAVMALAYFFPRIAIGLILLVQILRFFSNIRQYDDGEV